MIIPARTVVTVVEDATVDLVCFEVAFAALGDRVQAGRLAGYVEAVLEANPGLAAAGAVLPLGTRIDLPAFAVAPPPTRSVRLWD